MTQLTPGTYSCDRCGTEGGAKRLPPGWRRRGDNHICPACWTEEPAERTAVWRYAMIACHPGETFWREQRAARCLWDGLVDSSEQALAEAQAIRATVAPEAVAAAEMARVAVAERWREADAAKQAARLDPTDANTVAAAAATTAAREAGRALSATYAEAKRAAKAAGADERPAWQAHEQRMRAAPTWTYAETTDEQGRSMVVRQADGWRLSRSHADLVVAEYQRAWAAWISRRADGRGMPRRHGQGIGDRVRAVATYSNGTDAARLAGGTLSTAIMPEAYRRGRTLARVQLGDLTGFAVLHRPVPDTPDAIRAVTVSGQRRGWDRWQWSLLVTCRQAMPARAGAAQRSHAIAVDLGWRADNRRIQVAHWMADDGARGVVAVDRAQTRRRQAKAGLPSSWDEMAALQAEADDRLEAIKRALWPAGEPYSQPWRLMRSGGLLRAVRRGEHPEAADWAAWHIRTMRRLARCRARLIARRDQRYYEAAHAICRQTRVLVLEDDLRRPRTGGMDLRRLASGDDAVAGALRHLASPSRLRSILLQVAPLYGVAVRKVDPRYTLTTCPDCGQQAEAGPSQHLTCPAGHRYHQDWAACRLMLARERSGGGGEPGTARGGAAVGGAAIAAAAGAV